MAMRDWLTRRRVRLDEQDFQDEIRAHLEMAARERMADGADAKAARQASLKEFGNVTLTTEAARRVWLPRPVEWIRDLAADVRYAVRALARHPAFSMTVIAVLTLGIGLNAVVFSMLKTVALTPLSGVARSTDLRVILGRTAAGRAVRVSYPDYQTLKAGDLGFADLFGSSYTPITIGRGRSARTAGMELVTGNYFQALGVRAALGRTLLPADEIAPGRHPVVVISHSMWQRDFRGDPGIVGRTIVVNNQVLTIAGVADPAFHGTIVSYDIELFVPLMMAAQMGVAGGDPNVLSDRAAGVLFPQGFLKAGTSTADAAARVAAVWSALAPERPIGGAVQEWRVVNFRLSPTGAQSVLVPLLVVLSAMGLLVMAIACANIAGLVVVRGASRRGEIAVRLALGASRARILRLLFAENLVLAVPGAVLGFLVSGPAIAFFVRYCENLAAPSRLFFNLQTDGLVVAFSVAVACGSALVFGFLPAWRGARVDLVSTIKEETPRGAARGRMRAGLVVAQVAVSLALLVGAGLMTRSLQAAEHADRGYDNAHLTAVAVDLGASGYSEAAGRVFFRHLVDNAGHAPGIDAATLAENRPLTFLDTRAQPVVIDGYDPRRDEDLSMLSNTVAPAYFETMRIPLAAGREFEWRDDERAAPVAVVNRTFAERFWRSAISAVGQRIRVGADPSWRTIVGVAADIKYSRVEEPPRPYIYLPFLQHYRPAMLLHTRGTAPMTTLVDQARAAVSDLDRDLPVPSAKSLDDATRGALLVFRLMAVMLFAFGTAGMILAAMGTYGLIAYAVRESTQEIGIRMALGASGTSVLRLFLARGLALGCTGAALGAAGALGAAQLLRSVLFGVSTTNPASFIQAFAIVLGGVAAATLWPAWRASRLNPLVALRRR